MFGISERMQGKGLAAQLARGGVGTVFVRIGGTVLGLVLAVVLARILGPEEYGVYAYVFALVSILAIPAQFGLPKLVVRETAKAQVAAQWGLMRGIWRWTTIAVLRLSLTIIVVAGAAAWLFAEHFRPSQLATFAWGLVLLPLAALAGLRGAALQGLRRVSLGQMPEGVLRPLFTVLLVVAFAWGNATWHLNAATAMALNVASATAAFVIGAWLLYTNRPEPLRASPAPVYDNRAWLASAWPLALVAGMQQVNTHTDIVMLGLFVSAEEVGIYRVAAQGALFVIFGLQVVAMLVSPYLARLHAQNDRRRLQRLVTVSARLAFVTSLAITLVYLFWGDSILRALFGVDYLRSYEPLLILSAGQVVNGMFGPVGLLLSMTGHERDTAKGVTVAALCNVALSLVLIPLFGMNGAAASTAVTLMLWNVILWRFALKRLDVNCRAF